jgi:hypothetical protein
MSNNDFSEVINQVIIGNIEEAIGNFGVARGGIIADNENSVTKRSTHGKVYQNAYFNSNDSIYKDNCIYMVNNCIFVDSHKLVNSEFQNLKTLLKDIRNLLKNDTWVPDLSSTVKIIVSLNPYNNLPSVIYECSIFINTASIVCIHGNCLSIKNDMPYILEFFVQKTRICSGSPAEANATMYQIYYYSRYNLYIYDEEENFKFTLTTIHNQRLEEPMYEFSSTLYFNKAFNLPSFIFYPTFAPPNSVPLLCGYNSHSSLFTTGFNLKTFKGY